MSKAKKSHMLRVKEYEEDEQQFETLYARGVKSDLVQWLKEDVPRMGYPSMGAYLNELLALAKAIYEDEE